MHRPMRMLVAASLLALLAAPPLGRPLQGYEGAHAGALAARPSMPRVADSNSTATSVSLTATVIAGTSTAQAATTTAVAGLPTATGSLTPVGTPTATGTVLSVGTLLPAGSLTLNPSSGPPGSKVNIGAPVGSFAANSNVFISYLDQRGVSTVPLGNFTTDAAGGLAALGVALPAQTTAGFGTIVATDTKSQSLTALYQITPVLVVTSGIPLPGATLTITGEGFAGLNPISFLSGGAPLSTSGPVSSDASGQFVATVTIPAAATQSSVIQVVASDRVHVAVLVVQIGSLTPTITPTAVTTPTSTFSAGGQPTIPLITPPPSRTPTPGSHTPTPTTTPTRVPGTPGTSTPVVTPSTGPNLTTAYFAEGYTGQAKTNKRATFNEELAILNPNASPAAVSIRYAIAGHIGPLVISRVLRAGSVLRESVNQDVGPDQIVAAVVTSPQHLYVVRTIDRTAPDGHRLDGSTTGPIAAPAASFGFAEGYTGASFQEYLTLFNPAITAARVTIRLAPQATDAGGGRIFTLSVPAQGRVTKSVREVNVGTGTSSVGMLVSSSIPVVAERVEYFGDGVGSGKFGATVSGGLPSASDQLRIGTGFSGGATTDSRGRGQPVGDQEYVTLLNPNLGGKTASVTVGFNDAAGNALGNGLTVSVPPGTRQTVGANAAIGAKAAGPFSVTLSAADKVGIQAEAAQYFGGSPNLGRHPGVALAALTAPIGDAYFADLSTSGSDGTALNRMVYLYNPLGSACHVAATYVGPSGATVRASYTVGANGIVAIDVGKEVRNAIQPGAVGGSFHSDDGYFVASSVARTADGQSAIEEVGAPSS